MRDKKTTVSLDLTPLPVVIYELECGVCHCHIVGIREDGYDRPVFTHDDTRKWNDCPNSLRRFAMRGTEVYRLD